MSKYIAALFMGANVPQAEIRLKHIKDRNPASQAEVVTDLTSNVAIVIGNMLDVALSKKIQALHIAGSL